MPFHSCLKWGGLTFESTVSLIATGVPLMSALQTRVLRTIAHPRYLCAPTGHSAGRAGWINRLLSQPQTFRPLPTAVEMHFCGEDQDRRLLNFWQLRRTREWCEQSGGNGVENDAQAPKQKEANLQCGLCHVPPRRDAPWLTFTASVAAAGMQTKLLLQAGKPGECAGNNKVCSY